MFLLTVFSVLALSLAAVGLYGVLAYSVAQRAHEIGIRIALGAQPRDVFKLVIGQSVLLSSAGGLFGLAGAFALS
jgi:putative ABC transport system permease protein